jgi:GDP-L-fucose synthase
MTLTPNKKKAKKIFLAGGSGFVGSSLALRLNALGYKVIAPSHKNCDLTVLKDCIRASKGADVIVHSAGVISSRKDQVSRPADIFYANTVITLQLLEAAKANGIKEVLLIGSVTGYPARVGAQKEEYLLLPSSPTISGAFGFYGLSRWLMVPSARAYGEQWGIKVRVVILSNLYGPKDKFEDAFPPLVPKMIREINHAVQSGSSTFNPGGSPGAAIDLLYVDDACDLLMAVIKGFGKEPFALINGGSGRAYSINEVVSAIAKRAGFNGKIVWADKKKLPTSFLDITAARKYRWKPRTSLDRGIGKTLDWFDHSYGKK